MKENVFATDAGLVTTEGQPGGIRFPGPPGFHVPGEIRDPGEMDKLSVNVKKTIKFEERDREQIKHLNQYIGYFTTPEGDFPVAVVADSMKEAARILTMPGAFGNGVEEPSTIKFIKGKIAVTVPVRMTGFNVIIDPVGAAESGAYATPAHADVKNGTDVIFTAFEPFGWKFLGWFKGDQCLSTEKVTSIDVYDPYSSLIEYTAKYEFDPTLRNGRYLELGRGWYWDFKFDKWSNYEGKAVLYTNIVPDWHFVIQSYDPTSGQIVLISDPAVIQEPEVGMTLTLSPTAIGFNLIVNVITVDNPFGLLVDQQLSMKWMKFHGDYNPGPYKNK